MYISSDAAGLLHGLPFSVQRQHGGVVASSAVPPRLSENW